MQPELTCALHHHHHFSLWRCGAVLGGGARSSGSALPLQFGSDQRAVWWGASARKMRPAPPTYSAHDGRPELTCVCHHFGCGEGVRAGWWCSFLGADSPTAVRIRPAGGVVGRIHTCYSACTTHTLHTRWAARTNLCVPSFRLWRRGACWVVVLVPRGRLAHCSSDPAIGRCGGARPHVTWNEAGRQWLGMVCSRVDGR